MSKRITVSLIIIILFSIFFQPSVFAQSRLEYPNDFGIEIGGKSIVYSFTYQRMLNHYIGLEGGISALGGGDSDGNATVIFFPVGAKAYLLPKNGSPFITGGIVFINASVESGPFEDSTSNSYTYAGLGFEYRAEGGFIFRGTAYGLISEGSFFIWPGLHVGYAF
ncbi:MAG: hypothetical protein U5O15_04750 [Candidatus Krumholzibacteriota bacterium]|nr:hypothetical protein [Candidatus Krumholzibacteriota bacterium]